MVYIPDYPRTRQEKSLLAEVPVRRIVLRICCVCCSTAAAVHAPDGC